MHTGRSCSTSGTRRAPRSATPSHSAWCRRTSSSGGESETRGPGAILQLIEQSVQVFDDVRVSLDVGPIVDAEQTDAGTLVAGLWTFHGRYLGGIPGTRAEPGTRVAFSGTDIVRVQDGLIREYWVTADGDHMMSQL